MFAHNERISSRQFGRLLTLELFGVTTVLLPQILCKTVRRDGVTALIAGVALVVLYALLLRSLAKRAGKSLQKSIQEKNRLLYELFLFVMIIQLLLMGVWVLSLAAEMSRDILLQGSDLRMVILTFAAVCVLGAAQGMECRGRMAEVLYLFLLLPFLVLLVCAAAKVNPESYQPVFTENPMNIANGSYEVFIVFQGVTLGLFALPYLKQQNQFWHGVRRSILLNGLFCLLLLVVAVGIFGLEGAAGQNWLAVNLMTTPDFRGGLVERLDVFMVTIWIVALFFFVSGVCLYSGIMTGRLFRIKHERGGIWIVGVLLVAGSMLLGNKDYAYYIYMNYMKYIGVPILLVMLLLICWKLNNKRAVGVAAVLLLIAGLGGCARGVELEDRAFLLTLGADCSDSKAVFYYNTPDMDEGSGDSGGSQSAVKIETEAFGELQTAFGQQSDKYLDYNHLKAVVIGQELASDPEKLEEFLQYIETNELFARNVKVFFTEDLEGLFALCEEMSVGMGEYLENLYVDSSAYVEEQSTTLGDLQSHRHEDEETLMVPVLKAQGSKAVIDGYALVRKLSWQDTADTREASLLFLGNGKAVQMEVAVQEQYELCLDEVQRDITWSGQEEPQATLVLHMRGSIINEDVRDEKRKRELEKACEDKLEKLYAAIVSKWRDYDCLHVFATLGSKNRALWKEYHDSRPLFYERLQLQVQVECELE